MGKCLCVTLIAALLLLFPISGSCTVPANVICVDSLTGDDDHDGEGWGDAVASVERALEIADGSTTRKEVWVAAGTYDVPESGTFDVPDGVELYGGFAGAETALEQRSWQANQTTLQGNAEYRNLVARGGLATLNFHEAGVRVVAMDADGVVDGFTITNGVAGIFTGGSGQIRHNTFADDLPVGIYGESSTATVANNTFYCRDYTEIDYYGVWCAPASMRICNNIFEGCDVGVYSWFYDTSTVVNNTFLYNEVGIEIDGLGFGAEPVIANNIVVYGGKGIFDANAYDEPTLNSNCVYGNVYESNTCNYDPVDLWELDPSPVDDNPSLVDTYWIDENSPCLDAGNNDYVLTGEVDMDGEPRRMGGGPPARVDIGADEVADWTPPDLTWADMGTPACTNDSPFDVEYSGVSDPSGIASVTLWYRKDSSQTWLEGPTNTSGNASGSFSFVPTAGNGTYHFAISAIDTVGNSSGTPTSAIAESAYAGAIVNPNGPQIELNYEGEYTFSTDFWCTWRIASDTGVGSSYQFGVGTSPCASATPDVTPGWVSKTPSDLPYYHCTLPTGTPCYVFIKASNPAGQQSILCRKIAVVASDPTGPPARPTELTATATGTSTIDLTWTDNSSEDGFYVERRLAWLNGSTTAYPYVRVATLAANSTSFADTGLPYPNSTYYYRVRAYRYDGGALTQSCFSSAAWDTTEELTGSGIEPTELVATAISATEVVLTWSRGDVDMQGVRNHVERRPVTVPESSWTALSDTGYYAEYYTDSGLTPDTEYQYRVSAYTGAATSDWVQVAVTTPSTPTTVLDTIVAHPRLLVTDDRIADVKGYVDPLSPQYQPQAEVWYNTIKSAADTLSAKNGGGQWIYPPQSYTGVHNYTSSTEYMYLGGQSVYNIGMLAAMHLLTTDPEVNDGATVYGARGIAEVMEAIKSAGDPTNPSWGHPVDDDIWLARRIAGVAIGYDWLYDQMSSEERTAVAAKIKSVGLDTMTSSGTFGWLVQHYNHCMTSNAGTVLGALAIAGDSEAPMGTDAEARFIIARAIGSTRQALHSFDPGGAWCEGPLDYFPAMYDWAAYECCALETALEIGVAPGAGVGLLKLINHETPYGDRGAALGSELKIGAGIANAGTWSIYVTHPQGGDPYGGTFAFGDSRSEPMESWGRLYFGEKFSDNLSAWQEEQIDVCTWDPNSGGGALDLLWFKPQSYAGPGAEGLPLAARFTGREIETVSMRSAWEDANATVVGVRGGSNKGNHAHADLGTFVLDALGFRWADDLGYPETYDNMWDTNFWRWIAERTRTESHNTVLIDGQNQSPRGTAPVALDTTTDGQVQEAVVDLTDAYSGQGSSIIRRISLVHRNGGDDLVVRDKVTASADSCITSGFITPALATPAANLVTLRHGTEQNPHYYYARLVSPANASWSACQLPCWMPETVSAVGVRNRVGVVLAEPVDVADISYVFSPSASGDVTPPADINLSVSAVTSGSITLQWTAPGDDGMTGTADQYDIRWSDSAGISDMNWAGTAECSNIPSPASGGTVQTLVVGGLQSGRTYYFGIRAVDDTHNWTWVSSAAGTTN